MAGGSVPAQAPDELVAALVERLRARGVWDAHGSVIDRPQSRRPVVVGRVADAEPLLSTEVTLAQGAADRVVRGLAALGMLYRAERLVLAIREDAAILVQRMREQAQGGRLEVVSIPRSWPLDASSLLCDLSQLVGKSVREAGLEQTLVVDSVELHDIAVALEERFPLRRAVTVAGAVREAGVLLVPLGTSLADLVNGCGGSDDLGWTAWHNGVLGGRQVSREHVVDVDTRGVIVLPHDHPLVVRETVPLRDAVSRACSACTSCRRCTDVCPAHLNGSALEPHRIMELVARSWSESALQRHADVLGVLSCMRCRLCSVACPGRQDPAMLVAALGDRLRRRGVKPSGLRELRPCPDRLGRRVAVWRLTQSLGLEPYASSLPTSHHVRSYVPDRLTLPLRDPWGRVRVPVVREGARLELGEVVLLGAAGSDAVDLRAPVAGTVISVDPDDGVVIRAR